jgi:hypothetical protein
MSEEELRQLIASNARSIQAMLEQRETDRLLHEEQMGEMRDNILRLARVEEGLANSCHRSMKTVQQFCGG